MLDLSTKKAVLWRPKCYATAHMTNNDVLRSLRYVLNVSDAGLAEIVKLGGMEVSPEDISLRLLREEDPSFVVCADELMAHFLNGLVTYKRGKDETRPPQAVQLPVTNNLVLKKIRVAFELKDVDLTEIIQKSGLVVTKSEMSAFFRTPGHRNYRECGDQFLRNLIRGLSTTPAADIPA